MIKNHCITETSKGTKRHWFNVNGNLKKEYSVWIEIFNKQIIDSSCDCVFGSFYGNAKRFGGKKCRHIKACLEKLRKKGYL